MNKDTVIKVESVSKHFFITHENINYNTAQKNDDKESKHVRFNKIKNRIKSITKNKDKELFHALDNINFEIKRGERVGIIGRNGAGKSTLLKILSRITLPTTGEVKIRGRVSSLLEVGTGFHPELTGKENIFLNGAILGMSTDEIKNNFDEIVEFAGVEKFIDTPVKRYSSGMYVRLAFAVAAHLNTNILIIDEVLAVGDALFQKKCLSKINQISGDGRTIIFVSHQLSVIRALCSRVLMLEEGKLQMDGCSSEVVNSYQNNNIETVPHVSWSIKKSPGDHVVRLIEVSIKNIKKEFSNTFDVQDEIIIEMHYFVLIKHEYPLTPNLRVFDSNGDLLFFTADTSSKTNIWGEHYISKCVISPNLLNEGRYSITAAVSTVEIHKPHFYEENIVSFEIVDFMKPGGARHPSYTGEIKGVIRPKLKWSIEKSVKNEVNENS